MLRLSFAIATIAACAHLAAAQRYTELTLTNGRVVSGIVRAADSGYEVLRHGRYVRAQEDERGAGIRLFDPQGANGFVFVPRARIASQTDASAPKKTASSAGTKPDTDAIHRGWAEWRAREREARFALRVLRRAPGDDDIDPEDARRIAQREQDAALLDRFPTQEGFTPEYRDHLKWRQVVIGVFPSAEEREWLANYDAWLAALERKERERRRPQRR